MFETLIPVLPSARILIEFWSSSRGLETSTPAKVSRDAARASYASVSSLAQGSLAAPVGESEASKFLEISF